MEACLEKTVGALTGWVGGTRSGGRGCILTRGTHAQAQTKIVFSFLRFNPDLGIYFFYFFSSLCARRYLWSSVCPCVSHSGPFTIRRRLAGCASLWAASSDGIQSPFTLYPAFQALNSGVCRSLSNESSEPLARDGLCKTRKRFLVRTRDTMT